MAFVMTQQFDEVEHHYDREGDVLYVSFGPPVPAVSLTIEDWLVIRMTPEAPRIAGFTIIGFKRLFSKIRPDLIQEFPTRVERLKRAHFQIRFADETDTLTFRFEDEQPAYYERFGEDIYLERAVVGGNLIGFKITHYTERGIVALSGLLSAMLDALFAPPDSSQRQTDDLTRAFLEHLNLPQILSEVA